MLSLLQSVYTLMHSIIVNIIEMMIHRIKHKDKKVIVYNPPITSFNESGCDYTENVDERDSAKHNLNCNKQIFIITQ